MPRDTEYNSAQAFPSHCQIVDYCYTHSWSVVSCQLSVGQWSVVGGPLSVVRCQLSDHGQLTTDH
ncbi:hypothetical protein QUF72_10405 [Desulfobacterales bacterium HSG2]|nr:hypothetical protein [Desulfobacterales bacterium HSG2]